MLTLVSRFVIAGGLILLVLTLVVWRTDAQDGAMTEASVEGRIVAQLLSDGRIQFGFQPEGRERILPRSRFFPASSVGQWLVSSAVFHDGADLGQITALRLDDGRVEFGFIPTGAERILPRSRFFPVNARVDRWLLSSVINVSGVEMPAMNESDSDSPPYTCVEASAHTPLHAAVNATDATLVRSIVASCLQYLDLVSGEYFYDQTPLSLAIGRRNSDIVQILIDAGADPDKRIQPDFRVGTHLTYAIGLSETAIAQILLDADADPNVVDTEQFYDQTPLSLAIAAADETLLDSLIAAGADPDTGVNPAFRVGSHLTYAVGLGNVNVVQKLVDAGANANVVDTEQFYDQTPLSLAIKSGDQEMLRKLIAAGADPDQKINPDFRVGTHLTYAVGLGDADVVQILLDAGADPNVVDMEQFYEESPLSLAVKERDAEMVRFLVAAGSNPNQILDQFNDVSPIDIAIEEGYSEILQILQAAAQNGVTGDATEPPMENATSESSLNESQSTSADGDCMVDLIVNPGESCVYPGTSVEFSVDSSGQAHFLFLTYGNSLSLRDSTVNGVQYDFAANKQSDGGWIITAVGS